MRRRLCILAMAPLLLIVAACQPFAPAAGPEKKLAVTVTLFPLYDMARAIGGPRAKVSMLLRPGVEAHAFEPVPADILAIAKADIFIYTAAEMEPWAAEVLRTSKNPDRLVVEAGAGIPLITGQEVEEREEHANEYHLAGGDPHIWLDFDNAQIMARNIAAGFSRKDPTHRAEYEAGADKYNGQLKRLDNDYRRALSHCATNKVIHGGHFAFGYLARRYGLEYHAASRFSPEAEVSPRTMVALAKQLREGGGRAIFYEELVLPKTAEAISRNTGAPMLLLNAAHNVTAKQAKRGVTFVGLMRQNLAALQQGLGCK